MQFVHDIPMPDTMDYGADPQLITIEDCLDNYKYKNKRAIINDGQILGWMTES